MKSTAPKVAFIHVTLDAKGHTVTHHCTVSSFAEVHPIKGSPAIWTSADNFHPVSQAVWVMAPDWRGGWHTNPQRQLVVPISGSWWVETQDGVRTVMGPGDLYLGDDVGGLPDDAGRLGHDSGTVGDEPVVLLMIPVSDYMPTCACSSAS